MIPFTKQSLSILLIIFLLFLSDMILMFRSFRSLMHFHVPFSFNRLDFFFHFILIPLRAFQYLLHVIAIHLSIFNQTLLVVKWFFSMLSLSLHLIYVLISLFRFHRSFWVKQEIPQISFEYLLIHFKNWFLFLLILFPKQWSIIYAFLQFLLEVLISMNLSF